jgi:hypothetical protein
VKTNTEGVNTWFNGIFDRFARPLASLGADTLVHGAIENEASPLILRVPGVMKKWR